MKKSIVIYSLFLATGLLVGCEDDNNLPVPAPGAYEQEELQDNTLKIELKDAASPLILEAGLQENLLNLLQVSQAPVLNETASITYKAFVSKTEDVKLHHEIGFASNGTLAITVAALDQEVKSLFGKRPQPNTLFVKMVGYIKDNTTLAAVQSNTVSFQVTPIASVIEEKYYIIGDVNNWSAGGLLEFNHSDKDVYEDPVFTYIGDMPAGNFKIVPLSAAQRAWDGGELWGPEILGTAKDQDESLTGTLVDGNQGAIRFAEGGYVKISLNLEEFTYAVEPLAVGPYLWIPGNHQGWKPAEAPQMYSSAMDLTYKGWTYLDGEFKFTSHPDWDHTNYGNGGDNTLSDDSNAGNMKADAGFYYLYADLAQMNYTMMEQVWGIVGDATAGGWDADTEMTYDRTENTWSITTDLKVGSFKFRANNNWDYNFGGTPDAVSEGGDNIAIAEAGNYTIVLTLSNASENTYTITRN